ncbi:MAG: hypothetical protein ACK41T_02285 [Pseudobdellovibrio sp.]
MFKAITFTAVLIISLKLEAFIPIDLGSALQATSSISSGVGSAIDMMETSTDLLNEIGEGSSEAEQFIKDISEFNRGIKSIESDMRDLGYTEEQIQYNIGRITSSRSTLEQKMKALNKSIKSIKKMGNMLSQLSSATGGGSKSDPATQAILSTQQQLLHIQFQQLKNEELKTLNQEADDLSFRKSIATELDKAKIDLIKSKENDKIIKISKNTSLEVSDIQKKAIQISLTLCVLGCIGLMISFFRSEGMATLKTGFFGVVISYLLPSIVSLYTKWLGI